MGILHRKTGNSHETKHGGQEGWTVKGLTMVEKLSEGNENFEKAKQGEKLLSTEIYERSKIVHNSPLEILTDTPTKTIENR